MHKYPAYPRKNQKFGCPHGKTFGIKKVIKMNFFSMLFAVLITAVFANRHSYHAHIQRITGVIPGHGGHVFGTKQISKCDKLRYKMMLKNRHRPDLVRQIYNLNLEC